MLKHTALYAKNWYLRSETNIWSDIIKCLQADDYMPMDCDIDEAVENENYEQAAKYFNWAKDNVIRILTNNVAKLIPNDKAYLMHSFIEAIDKRNCWKSGYFHAEFWGRSDWKQEDQDKLEPYDQRTAILWFYLSHLCMAETKTLWGDGEIPKPDRNVLPIRSEAENKRTVGA